MHPLSLARVGVTASVFCQTCREFAPRIGDGGAVGFPSLKDTPDTVTDDYQTFGYLKKGFDAIGYKPWELEAIAAFLKAHQRHNVSLFLENQDVRYDPDDYDDEDEDGSGPLDDVSDATEFVFDDTDFVEGLFEVACDKCGVSVRSGTERLRPFKPFTLTPAKIRTFMTRVRNVDGSNFHRVFHLLDYDGEQERLAQFLTDHANHRPKIRIVQGDAHAAPGHAQPWKLAWQKAGSFRRDRQPLIAAGRVFAIREPRLSGESAAPPVLHCYSLDGDELWQRDLPRGVEPDIGLTREGVILPVYGGESEHEMLCLDPDDGARIFSRRTPYFPLAWFPDRRAFVGSRRVSDPDFGKRHVAVVEWPSLALRWESPPFKSIDLSHSAHVTDNSVLLVGGAPRSPLACCLDAATGRERWTTSLAQFGAERVHDHLVWRDWLLAGVGKVVALHLSDGSITWQIDTNYFFGWHESDDLLRGYYFEKFVVVDLKERKLRFAVPRKQFAVALQPVENQSGHSVVAGDHILVVDQTGRTLSGLDGETGKLIWKHRPPGGVTGERPAMSAEYLVLQGPNTGLCCYTRNV